MQGPSPRPHDSGGCSNIKNTVVDDHNLVDEDVEPMNLSTFQTKVVSDKTSPDRASPANLSPSFAWTEPAAT